MGTYSNHLRRPAVVFPSVNRDTANGAGETDDQMLNFLLLLFFLILFYFPFFFLLLKKLQWEDNCLTRLCWFLPTFAFKLATSKTSL